mgnify:CR=1 FL=1
MTKIMRYFLDDEGKQRPLDYPTCYISGNTMDSGEELNIIYEQDEDFKEVDNGELSKYYFLGRLVAHTEIVKFEISRQIWYMINEFKAKRGDVLIFRQVYSRNVKQTTLDGDAIRISEVEAFLKRRMK